MGNLSKSFRFAKDCPIEGLFKFKSYERNVDIERAKALLSGRLYFAMPHQLNDPFEMRSRLILDVNKKRRRKAAKKRAIGVLKRQGGMTPAEIIKRASELAYRLERNPSILQNAEQQHHERLYNHCAVFSMAGTKKHPLLWSHYASKHSGICVEFDRTSFPFAAANEVQYPHNYPAVSYPLNDNKIDELVVKSVLTKAHYWSYEREFRIWSPRLGNAYWHLGLQWDDDQQTALIETALIKRVTLGARMSQQHREDVIDYCRSVCPHVQIEVAATCSDCYELEFQPLRELAAATQANS